MHQRNREWKAQLETTSPKLHAEYQRPGYLQSIAKRINIADVDLTAIRFSDNSVKYVESIDPKVILIDGRTLAELMIDYGLGTTSMAKYEIRRVDSDYYTAE